MTLKKVTYWLTTIFVTLVLGISGGMSIAHAAPLMKALEHLGYPEYFANILGIGKAIGLVVFLAPGMPRFKEWAYAGFSITILSACYSHLSSGDRLLALEHCSPSPRSLAPISQDLTTARFPAPLQFSKSRISHHQTNAGGMHTAGVTFHIQRVIWLNRQAREYGTSAQQRPP